jgi:hypothetical protein
MDKIILSCHNNSIIWLKHSLQINVIKNQKIIKLMMPKTHHKLLNYLRNLHKMKVDLIIKIYKKFYKC